MLRYAWHDLIQRPVRVVAQIRTALAAGTPVWAVSDRCFGSILPDIRQNTPKTTIMEGFGPAVNVTNHASVTDGHSHEVTSGPTKPPRQTQTTPFSEEPGMGLLGGHGSGGSPFDASLGRFVKGGSTALLRLAYLLTGDRTLRVGYWNPPAGPASCSTMERTPRRQTPSTRGRPSAPRLPSRST